MKSMSAQKVLVTALTAALMSVAAVASAAPIVFTTSNGSNPAVSGRATFEFSATTFTITLENLTSPTELTAQELDGLTFRLSPAGTPTLVSVTAAAILDCGNDNSNPCAPYAGVVAPNNGWGVSTSAGLSNLTTTTLGYHPYAIINSNYTLPGSGNGNLSNPEHNPLQVGPVVYTFNGTFNFVSDVTFFWGTQPFTTTADCTENCGTPNQQGVVPEPATLTLLGSGLLVAVRNLRRRRNQVVS
jgi:hypothetical protein